MKIAVCVKQVPDTTEIQIDPVKQTLIRTGVPSILNPFDRNAVETALELKDTYGGTVTVFSMGPAQAKAVLRETLAMGADQACLITDRAFGGSDTYATSYILARAMETVDDFDIILGGKQAIDGDTAQTAPSIAEHRGIICLTHVLDMKVEGKKVTARRLTDDGIEILETELPIVCTVTKESNKPRYATVRGVLNSLKADIKEIHLENMPEDLDKAKIGLNGSPTRVKNTFTPKRNACCEFVEGNTPGDTAKNLIGMLTAAKII